MVCRKDTVPMPMMVKKLKFMNSAMNVSALLVAVSQVHSAIVFQVLYASK